MKSLTKEGCTILFSPQERMLEISREDLKELSEHYRETDDRDARDNLYRAIWGCGCCEDIALALHKIKGGIDHEIVDAVITLIELYRKAGEL